jgi:hypothetical protein
MKRPIKIQLATLFLISFQLSITSVPAHGHQLSPVKSIVLSKALRVCTAAEKALIINYTFEIKKLIDQRVSLRNKSKGYLSEDERLLIDTQLLTLDIKISNSTDARDAIEKFCNPNGIAKKVKNCTKSEISLITNWARDYELKQRELKLQWEKILTAQGIFDSKKRALETSSNQKIYYAMQSAADYKKQEFEALNSGCLNSGIKLVAQFVPGKAASDQAATDKAAAEKLAADKAASDKASGTSIPKVGDCWDYTRSELERISDSRSSVPCTQQHTMVTYKVAFWPKTYADPYGLYSSGSLYSLYGAMQEFCGSIQRYELNLKSGTSLSTGGFLLPSKDAWSNGARWINCMEGLKLYKVGSSSSDDWSYVPWSGDPAVQKP